MGVRAITIYSDIYHLLKPEIDFGAMCRLSIIDMGWKIV